MAEPERDGPTYDLSLVKRLMVESAFRITLTALNGLGELGFDSEDVRQCIGLLGPSDFHKTMPSIQMEGLWQDVYKPSYCGHDIYLKIQVVDQYGAGLVVVVSFKRK